MYTPINICEQKLEWSWLQTSGVLDIWPKNAVFEYSEINYRDLYWCREFFVCSFRNL